MDALGSDLIVHTIPMKPSKAVSGALLRSTAEIDEAEILIIASPEKLKQIMDLLDYAITR